jgi:hypothetical protein
MLRKLKYIRLSPSLAHETAQPLVVGFSLRRPGFAPKAVHVEFVVDRVALGQVFLRVLQFLLVSVIPPLLHIHSCIVCGIDNGPVRGRSSIDT